MYRLAFILCLCVAPVSLAFAGGIEGEVADANGPLGFASVALEGTAYGTHTNMQGQFELLDVPEGHYTLVISMVGYQTWKTEINLSKEVQVLEKITLTEELNELEEVVVTGSMRETYISDSPVKVEVITSEFLKNNVSNNFVGAVENINGVQEQVNCGVCGTNDIRINGMEGPYTLVLIDGMPIMSALSSVYGFNGIPAAMIERIEVVKGPSSTLYGSEAVGGVINIITRKNDDMARFAFNSFYSSHDELNIDMAYRAEHGEKVTSIWGVNYFRNKRRLDFNHDNFTDIPLARRYSIFNNWSVKRDKGRRAEVALRYYTENRFGGTLQWEKEDKGSDEVYGEFIATDRAEVIGNYQLPLNREHIRLDYSMNYHRQESFYGPTPYNADQEVYFANLVWEKKYGKHFLVSGISSKYQVYKDDTPASVSDYTYIPGIFVQDNLTLTEKTDLLGGLRVDHHKAHGLVWSPRLNVKHNLSDFTTLRLNLGTGFRVVNLFTEDHAALTGARTVVIEGTLEPERSYNAALNLRRTYSLGSGVGNLDVDMFYTYFSNKIVPNYAVDPQLIVYDNLDGYGVSRGLSISADHKFSKRWSARLGGTLQDVYQVNTDEDGIAVKSQQEFAPVFAGTYALKWEVGNSGYSLALTGRVVGPQKLPEYDPPYERETISPWYTLHHLQVTKAFSEHVEVYAGVKNLLNYTQPSPLINPEDPFSDSFDTAYAYGPLQTRRLIVGLRFDLH